VGAGRIVGVTRRRAVLLHVAALAVLVVSIAEGDLTAALFAGGFIALWWVLQGVTAARARQGGDDP
jgi:hypothetical protein